MAETQVADPKQGNPPTVVDPAKGGTVLTGTTPEKGAAPLATGTTPELPHAWMSALTTEQKADADLVKALSKFPKGIPDLAPSYAQLEKKVGEALTVPNEKATAEEWAAFYSKIGRPAKPEDYKLEQVQLPEGLKADTAKAQEFLKVAHELGLNNTQANSLYGWYMAGTGKEIVEAQKIVKISSVDAEKAMRQEFGAEYDSRQAYMQRGFQNFATPALSQLFSTSGLGNHPDVIRMFIKIGQLISEHPFVDGSRGAHTETGVVGHRTDEQIAATMYPEPVK